MTAVADPLDEDRRRQFRRLLAISAAFHVGAFLLFGATPTWNTQPSGLDVISVEMVVAPGRPAAPARPVAPPPKPAEPVPPPKPAEPVPPPKPAEVAPLPPPPPVKKEIVLPKEATTPKPEVKPQPKPAPAPQRRELDPSELQQQPAPTENYEDLMARLRAEEPSEAPAPDAPVEVARAEPAASGSGRPVSPEVAAWMRRAKVHVRRSWVVESGFRLQALETRVSVRLDAAGTVLGEPQITRRSGNPWYDDGVVRGLQKASPLPPPPEAGEWEFIFVPEDSF